MKRLMHILFLSCLKATELIEKNFHVKLSITEKLQLKMHKMMCKACTNYKKQSTLIENGLKMPISEPEDKVDFVEFKSQISEKLQG